MVGTLQPPLVITWEKLPDDFILEEEPVESTAQPLLAGALRESLELQGYIQPQMLIASNLGICTTMNGNLVIKAPDWFFVKDAVAVEGDRRSYTPNLEGEIPQVVMEFLLETDGKEYAEMSLFIGVWSGEKEGRRGYWLRWWDGSGNLRPWAVEQLKQERQRAEKLAQQLKALGIEPNI